MTVSKVDYTLVYAGKDITLDVSAMVTEIIYTDRLTGAADELSIILEDTDRYWQSAWYPVKGTALQLYIRQQNGQLNCGTFEIDEPELSITQDGDIFTIKGLAAGITLPLRTKSSFAHGGKTLAEIAGTIATQLGLTVVGNVPAIYFDVVHQLYETPLQFLNRIGTDYGCVFSIRGNQLVFVHYTDLVNTDAVITIIRTDLLSLRLKDTTHKTFKRVRVKHFDTNNKVVVEDEEINNDPDNDSTDEDEIQQSRVTTSQQAKARAQYALFKNNTQGVGGDIRVIGNILLIAGNNIKLSLNNHFDGIYQIRESKHTLNRDNGYITDLNIQKIGT